MYFDMAKRERKKTRAFLRIIGNFEGNILETEGYIHKQNI